MAPHRTVLITGAAGRIGRSLRTAARGHYDRIRLVDILPVTDISEGEEAFLADIRDLRALESAAKGVDCVVHLAGIPTEDQWENILVTNIVGTYNVFEAARRQHVDRVVFASTNHVVGYHRRTRLLDHTALPRPDSRYAVSKVFGEALGRLYSDKYGLSVACLRIGSFQETPEDERQLETWLSPRDAAQLIMRSIDAPHYHFITAYGVSANTRCRWTDEASAYLAYRPVDNAEDFAASILSQPSDKSALTQLFHGGAICTIEFSGDVELID